MAAQAAHRKRAHTVFAHVAEGHHVKQTFSVLKASAD